MFVIKGQGMAAQKRFRIGHGGISIESSTFSPLYSTLDDFHVRRGEELLELPYVQAVLRDGRDDIDWLPALQARSLPGGQVTAETYQTLKTELLDRVRASLPLDGFYFDVHGAMSVLGMDDAEGDLATAIRALVGPACVISAGMDLHGNISPALVEAVDIFTCYRQAPHVDAMETKERGLRHLLRCLDEGIRPLRAWIRIPVILPGERTSTFVEPGHTVYAKLAESDVVPGVLDASLWVGYVWADQPRASATVVVSGTDAEAITGEAAKIARRYWDARNDFGFIATAGPADWCIDEAAKLGQKAVFISDSGDNPTAGGAGDMPYMTERLLAHPAFASGEKTAIVAAVASPTAVAACQAAGVGAPVDVTIGGVLDPVNGTPFALSGVVYALYPADPVGGDIAVVMRGGVHVIIPSRRKPYHHIQEFRNVNLDPAAHDVTVVKIGYLEPELREAASAAFLALTPGAVNQDIPSLPFHRVQRPVYPLDPAMPDPTFDVRLFGSTA